jgi:hypothetical protein
MLHPQTPSRPTRTGDRRGPVARRAADPADDCDAEWLWRRRATRWGGGAAAAKAAAEDGEESPPPNDYYIRNVNPRLRTLPVRDGAPITVNVLAAQATGSSTKDVPVDLAKLASYFPNSGTPPFWITVVQGQVTEMAQQYLP